MTSPLTDQSSISDILLYAANPADLTPSGSRPNAERDYAQALLHEQYREGMRHLGDLALLILHRNRKEMDAAAYCKKHYISKDDSQMEFALHLLQFMMDNRPDSLIHTLQSYHRWYVSEKQKPPKPERELTPYGHRIVELSRHTGKYRARFEKRDIPERKRIADFDYLIKPPIPLTDLRWKLFLQNKQNSRFPYHNLYMRIKGIPRTKDKFLRLLRQAEALQSQERAVRDIFGIKVIALDWGIMYAGFENMVYNRLRDAGWEVMGKKDFRVEEGKTLGIVRYYVQRVDDPRVVVSLQYTTLIDYFLDEFFSEQSHFRLVINPNKVSSDVAQQLRMAGKSKKKLEGIHMHGQNRTLMADRLSSLYEALHDALPKHPWIDCASSTPKSEKD